MALARLGWHCSILEQDPHRLRTGQGLLLPPCGRGSLQQLGITNAAAAAAGHPIHSFELCGRDGSPLRRFPIAGSLALLHRDLLSLLTDALPASARLIDRRCTGLELPSSSAARILSSDGQRWSADLIVAADGVGSLCRQALFADARLTAELVTELVLVTHAPGLVQALDGGCRKLHDHPAGLALGLMPCRNDQMLLYAQIATGRHAPPEAGAGGTFLNRHFRGWTAPLDALLDQLEQNGAGDGAHIWHTTDLDPLPRLHHDNVVLVGDSGHPLLPFTSQGAASALEDAVALAAALDGVDPAEPGALNAALERYSRARLPVLRQMLQEGRDARADFLTPPRQPGAAKAPLVGFGLNPAEAR